MPAYGHQRYIQAAIDSVLAQSVENWELIVIDDASQDDTWAIVEGYRDARVHCIRHQENRGAPNTINEGLRLAKAHYTTILNSDDVYHPDRLAACLSALDERGLDLIGTDLALINAAGETISSSENWWISWHDGLKELYRESGDLLTTLFMGNVFVTTSNFFFRSNLINQIGQFRDWRYVHDYDFCLRAIEHPDVSVAFIADNPSLAYRLHGANTILENRMAAARETFDLLSQHYPRVVALPHQALALAFATQLRKVESYIEEEHQLARVRKSAQDEQRIKDCIRKLQEERLDRLTERSELFACRQETAELTFAYNRLARTFRDGILEACNQDAAAKPIPGEPPTIPDCDRTQRQLHDLRSEIEHLRSSFSFRLGNALTAPGTRVRQLVRMLLAPDRVDAMTRRIDFKSKKRPRPNGR